MLTARVGANAGTLYRRSGKVKITDNTVFLQGNNIDFVFCLLYKFDLKKLSFGLFLAIGTILFIAEGIIRK